MTLVGTFQLRIICESMQGTLLSELPLPDFSEGIPKPTLGGGDPPVVTHMEAFCISELINSPLNI